MIAWTTGGLVFVATVAAAVLTIEDTTHVALPTFVLIGVVVLLTLVGWFYWSATRGNRREVQTLHQAIEGLNSDKADLAAHVNGLEAAEDRLNRENADLKSEAASLRERLLILQARSEELLSEAAAARVESVALREDRARYEDALRTMAERSRRHVRHDSQHIIYVIGDTPADDMVTESYLTAAKDEKEPLLWHHVNVGLTNQPSFFESFRDLRHKSVFEVLPSPSSPPVSDLHHLSTGRRNNRLGVLVFFEPEIGTTVRAWRITYGWPGMWDPLRVRHRDTSILRLGDAPRVECGLLTVTFVFPRAAINPRVRTGPGSPSMTLRWDGDLQGRHAANFETRDPSHDDYDWILEVDDFVLRREP